jgi:CubicO group peptidase (beta-lactamase class C family)
MVASCADQQADGGGAAPSKPVIERPEGSDALEGFLAPLDTSSFSETGLAALEARVQGFVDNGEAGGVATLLVKDGKIVQHVEAGLQNVETGAPISQDTIFRIYSMTKPIIGVAMMMLYEEGAFSLDDPISKFVPEFADLSVVGPELADGSRSRDPLERAPTMRDLLSHTAGFSYGFLDTDPLAPIYREKQILASPNLDVFIERLADAPLLHQPGAQWNYSVAVDVQGAIIERITGKSLGEYLQEAMFDPLGMKDTGFRVPDSDFSRLADGFMVDPETGALAKLSEEQINGFGVVYREGAPLFEAGGYGLASTLIDYARFCQMLANGGELAGKRYLEEETIDLMRTNILPEDQPLETPGLMGDSGKPGTGFGLNFGVVYNAETSPTPFGQGTYFWGGLASTWFWIDPEYDLFFIGMVQVYPAAGPVADFRRETADIVYSALNK